MKARGRRDCRKTVCENKLASTPDQITLSYVMLQVPRVGCTNKKARSNVRAFGIGNVKSARLTAQECRNFEMVVFAIADGRSRTPMRIELHLPWGRRRRRRGRPACIFGVDRRGRRASGLRG